MRKAISRTRTHCRRSLTLRPIAISVNGSNRRQYSQYPTDYVCAEESSLWLFNQMMVERIANQFRSGPEL
jgi:hypothetical protein